LKPLRLELTAHPLDHSPCSKREASSPERRVACSTEPIPQRKAPGSGEATAGAYRPGSRRPGRPLRFHPPAVPPLHGEGKAGPSYPWSRGTPALYCVQHTGREGEDEVPYPITVHDEASHQDEACRGPGHDAPGVARHILACSAIAAVAYALGVGEQKARYWWEKGWILVNGVSTPEGHPPPGGVIRLGRRIWHDAVGRALMVPPGRPRPGERHYPVIQWCVRAPAEAEAPFPAQVHACQDHRGRPCYPPAPWLPGRHHHIHIAAKSPAGAISRALGVARKTAKRLVKREGTVLLEGETARLFALREEHPAPPPSSPRPMAESGPASYPGERVASPGEETACLSRGIAIDVHLEAPWSCR
jgi:hypothetical protein